MHQSAGAHNAFFVDCILKMAECLVLFNHTDKSFLQCVKVIARNNEERTQKKNGNFNTKVTIVKCARVRTFKIIIKRVGQSNN